VKIRVVNLGREHKYRVSPDHLLQDIAMMTGPTRHHDPSGSVSDCHSGAIANA